LILDAHVHLPCYDDTLITLEDKKVRLLEDLSKAGVDSAIVIADSELSSPFGTPQECVELFANTSNIFVIGGISPLIDYENRLSQIEGFLKDEMIVGCKLYPGHEAFYMDDERLGSIMRLCEKYNVPLCVHTGWDNAQYNHPNYFASIANEHPDLQIVICHLYWPEIDLCYNTTAAYPNIYYDISSLAYNKNFIEKTRASLNNIVQRNADRIIFGTDYGDCSIEDHIYLVNSLDIDNYAKQRILYNNAVKLYKLKI
jgi:hypothetical protein